MRQFRELTGKGNARGLACLLAKWFAVILFGANVWTLPAQRIAKTTLLTNATIIDGTGAPAIKEMTIVIEENRIVKLIRNSTDALLDYKDARIIDVKGSYVLPGLWNNHSHISDLLPDPKNFLEEEPLPQAVIRAGRNAMDALKAGFTTLKMVGERDFMDVAWKEAFDSGVFPGPRIIPSGAPLTGKGDNDLLARSVDGVDDIVQAVKDNVRNGAEIIKLKVDDLRPEEIKAAIETAHQLGVTVTGHAANKMAKVSVEFGIDCIEHGYLLTDETIRMMADKGVFYDPTIVCNLSAAYIKEREDLIKKAGYESDNDLVEGRILVAYADERDPEFAEKQRKILVKAAKAGIKIISGSDSNPIDELGILEIEQLVFSGLSEMAAIMAATSNSAEAVNRLDELGTIEEGKLADLIVLQKNPLENISNLRSISMVIKDGKLVNRSDSEGVTSFWNLYFLDNKN